MQKLISKIVAVGAVVCLPLVMQAATVSKPTNLKSLVAIIIDIIRTLTLLVFALTFLAVMWGVIKGWVIQGGDAEGVESGKKVVLVGVIALVIMSSIWGILELLDAGLFGA